VEKRADLGLLKGNHSEVKALVAELTTVLRSAEGTSEPDVVETNKGHGRIEQREVWAVRSGELEAYLEQEYGWPAVRWCGRIRRAHRPSHQVASEEVEEHSWIFGGRAVSASPQAIARWLRGYWTIENNVFHVLDVSYGEDRFHARVIGVALSKIRLAATNLIRALGYRYISDGWREISALPDRGPALAVFPFPQHWRTERPQPQKRLFARGPGL
jgi:hypothetical protein